METQKFFGANCYNCEYASKNSEPIDEYTLNSQGGITPQSQKEMQRAQKADLITLPGGSSIDVISKKFCHHRDIRMYVTIRMCCSYWNNAGVIRPWETSGILQPIPR